MFSSHKLTFPRKYSTTNRTVSSFCDFRLAQRSLISRYRFYANSRAEDAVERQNCSVAHEDDVTAAPTYVHTSRESREEWMYV